MFAYTVMLVVGISAGYLFFECNKYLLPTLLLLAVCLVARSIDLEYIPEKTKQERRILIVCALVGFFVFSISFIQMNGRLIDSDRREVRIDEVNSLTGRIISVTNKGEYLQMIIRPTSLHGVSKIQVNYYQEIDGDQIELLGKDATLYGELRVPAGKENPGCFNYRTYLYSKGIRYSFSCKMMKVCNAKHGPISEAYWSYKKKMIRIRESFLSAFKDKEISAFIRGVVFGDKSEIDEETLDEFNVNSTGHILAVSGLHVGFLFALLRSITRKKKSKLITAILITVIILYGEMTGWSPSTARAVLVLSISTLAIYARRTPDLLTSVSTAACFLLLIDPYNLVNSGFQLSFLALLGICFISKPLSFYVGDSFAVLLAIQLSVAPMIAYTFSSFNISSLFVNIPIVFLAGILVPICIIGLALMIIAGSLPSIITILISSIAEIVIRLNSFLSFDRLFVRDIQGISIGILLAYYLGLFFITSEWTRIKLLRNQYKRIAGMIPYLLIPVLCIGISNHNQFLNDEIVFVNVGQGDCTHIRVDDNDVLIDGGGNQNYNVGKNTLKPYLLHNGASDIDLALITHEHMDHYKGIEELNEIFPISAIHQSSMGEKIKVGNNVWIEAIWPSERELKDRSNSNENELNTVYIVHYDDAKIMVTGDLGEEDEMKIIEKYKDSNTLKCDVLKVGHHGSKNSTSEEWLDAVDPSIAVISVSANNTYGHPHQDVLDRLTVRGIKIYRTDLNGAVGIDIRRHKLKVDTLR